MMKKIGLSDLLITFGLSGLGIGIFLTYGIGFACIIDGSIILLLGILLSLKG